MDGNQSADVATTKQRASGWPWLAPQFSPQLWCTASASGPKKALNELPAGSAAARVRIPLVLWVARPLRGASTGSARPAGLSALS